MAGYQNFCYPVRSPLKIFPSSHLFILARRWFQWLWLYLFSNEAFGFQWWNIIPKNPYILEQKSNWTMEMQAKVGTVDLWPLLSPYDTSQLRPLHGAVWPLCWRADGNVSLELEVRTWSWNKGDWTSDLLLIFFYFFIFVPLVHILFFKYLCYLLGLDTSNEPTISFSFSSLQNWLVTELMGRNFFL